MFKILYIFNVKTYFSIVDLYLKHSGKECSYKQIFVSVIENIVRECSEKN